MRQPNVPREERIEIYSKLAATLDYAAELAEALQLPEWRCRPSRYRRNASAAREERDRLLEVMGYRHRSPDTQAAATRRERDAARKRQERRARSERTADAMMLPGGVNSLAWQLLHGNGHERSEDSES